MSSRLYNYAVAVTLARPRTYFTQDPNAVVVRDLRVAFSIEKSLDASANTASVTIYNFAEQTRAECQRNPLHVRLEAGYDGNLERLFAGDVRYVKSKLEGVDWITELSLGDGVRAIQHARVNRSFGRGSNALQAVNEIASKMDLKVPTDASGAKELIAKLAGSQFVNGVSLTGNASRELTRTLKPQGVDWSIQDGRLQLLRAADVNATSAYVITPENGLIGVPEYGAPEAPGAPPALSLTTLLYPAITPGARIRVESRSVRGTFRVERVRHTGDTHAGPWQSEIEAKPL